MAEERVPLEIRRAEPEDAAELLSIYAPYVEESWVTFECVPPTVEEFRRRMEEFSRHYPYLVCCRAGEILGYAYAHRHMEREAYQWNAELTVYVRRGREGLGIGTASTGRSSPSCGKWGWSTCTGCWDCPTRAVRPCTATSALPAGTVPSDGIQAGGVARRGPVRACASPPRTGRRSPFFGQKGGRRDDLEVSAADRGWVCLLAAALHGALTLYAAAVPYNIYQPGSTGLAEWLGMGLISHGLAHVMARLDELG